MRFSRSLDDLDVLVRDSAVRLQERVGEMTWNGHSLELLIYSTLRDLEAQAKLWRQGRSTSAIRWRVDWLRDHGLEAPAAAIEAVGPQFEPKIVTKAWPGFSFHQYGLAFDCVPLAGGSPIWKTDPAHSLEGQLWRTIGSIGEGLRLDWSGRWRTFREMAHFQAPRPAHLETNREWLWRLLQDHYGPDALAA